MSQSIPVVLECKHMGGWEGRLGVGGFIKL